LLLFPDLRLSLVDLAPESILSFQHAFQFPLQVGVLLLEVFEAYFFVSFGLHDLQFQVHALFFPV
jgi:hypothetical protein